MPLVALSTYSLVAACKFVVGLAFNINAPVIVPPPSDSLPFIFAVISIIKFVLLLIATANSLRVSNTNGAPLTKLLIVLLT